MLIFPEVPCLALSAVLDKLCSIACSGTYTLGTAIRLLGGPCHITAHTHSTERGLSVSCQRVTRRTARGRFLGDYKVHTQQCVLLVDGKIL